MSFSIYTISYSKILIILPIMKVATGGNLTISIYSKNLSNKLIIMPVGEDSPLQVSERVFFGDYEKKKRGLVLFWGISKIHTKKCIRGMFEQTGIVEHTSVSFIFSIFLAFME